ncbi:HAD family hydrolase [Pseudoalteromonas luteoviolacea]|uniref:HAD family hydrolase n=1 Tax=Pseudoalteromonas luteoviolacea TaxID=43657 RepID=UPI001F1688F5|nr:HAD family hydrolase [Pseudoalteromonas luteoviolacea]MCF6440357.1 HAD family hydrolase [Pseudoalteromonas luteoviolacea]
MIIGIDFDNTIADYTGVFYDVALKLDWIPESTGRSKTEVKSYFIISDNERKWTELQGIVYGKEIDQARPYTDCLQVLEQWHAKGHTLKLISHKTRYPIIGEPVDFHHAATNWLKSNGFIGSNGAPFSESDLNFNETKEEKLLCIDKLNCDLFIDDLESIFNHKLFPARCRKVLFNNNSNNKEGLTHITKWSDIPEVI